MSKPFLTIGYPTHDDLEGLFWSLHTLIAYNQEVIDQIQIVVVNNSPPVVGKLDPVDAFVASVADGISRQTKVRNHPRSIKYVKHPDQTMGPSGAKNLVFKHSDGVFTWCADSHVMFLEGAIQRLIDYHKTNPDTKDLYQGPLIYDNFEDFSSHFDDVWRNGMWGTWGADVRAKLPTSPEFEIDMQGCGLFGCRTDAWLEFNPLFREFGGEEGYIQAKYRKAGHKTILLPFMGWIHRFLKSKPISFKLDIHTKIRNYILGHVELELPLDRVHRHFVLGQNEDPNEPLNKDTKISQTAWDKLVRDPVTYPPVGCTPCEEAAEQQKRMRDKTLEELYASVRDTPSDINEHVPKLRELASQADVVVEFGTRRGVSTTGLLAGQPKTLYTVDTNNDPALKILEEKKAGTDLKVIQASSLIFEPIPCDLLFIDTVHTEAQVYNELSRHAPFCRGRIAFHDTKIFGEVGEDGGRGILYAIRRYLREHPEWSVIYYVKNNHGFMVISRLKEDKKHLPSILERGKNFAQAVLDYAADGMTNVSKEVYENNLDICSICPERNGSNCSDCGCFLPEKAKWRTSFCPLGYWDNTLIDHATSTPSQGS